MKDDVLIIPINKDESIVIATDCSGSVGEKENDNVKVDYKVTSYFMARVAIMEVLCTGAEIIGYTISNYTGLDWDLWIEGIKKALKEVGKENVPYIGSSESNFKMKESAMGITVIGKKKNILEYKEYNNYAVIGMPLVGNEVVDNLDKMITLREIVELRDCKDVGTMLPIGSEGVNWEFGNNCGKQILECGLDVDKSGGPSTCIVVNYSDKVENKIKQMFVDKYHKIRYL